MSGTARFQLPFILPGQAQKEVYHNEALTRIDAALHAAVEEGPLPSPPQAPQIGRSWIVAASATGDWGGEDHGLATWAEGGWRFIAPQAGMVVWNKTQGLSLHWDGTGWSNGELPVSCLMVGGQQVVGARCPPVASPSGGTTIDLESRAAIDAIIATLMSHGLID
jgi:hypothetical protein